MDLGFNPSYPHYIHTGHTYQTFDLAAATLGTVKNTGGVCSSGSITYTVALQGLLPINKLSDWINHL